MTPGSASARRAGLAARGDPDSQPASPRIRDPLRPWLLALQALALWSSACWPPRRRKAADERHREGVPPPHCFRPSLRPDASMIAPAVVVVLALAALLLIGPADEATTTGTTGTSATATGAVVDRTTFACPDVPTRRRTERRSGWASHQPRPRCSLRPAARSTQGPTTSDGKPVDVPRGSLVDVPAEGGPAVQATGGAAAGLFGFRIDVDNGRTLAVSGCAIPRSQWWFTGAGAGLDHSSTLLLANVDPGPAVARPARCSAPTAGRHGGDRGHHVAPALGQAASALRHRAADRRAAAQRAPPAAAGSSPRSTTRTARSPSLQPGHEWLAGTDLPSRTLRLDGLPGARARSTLLVANPSELEAIVEVQVAGKSGTFAPTASRRSPSRPAPSRRSTSAGRSRRRRPSRVRLRSRVPVVAAVRTTERAPTTPYATPVAAAGRAGRRPRSSGASTASVQLTAGAVGRPKVEVDGVRREGRRASTPRRSRPGDRDVDVVPEEGRRLRRWPDAVDGRR